MHLSWELIREIEGRGQTIVMRVTSVEETLLLLSRTPSLASLLMEGHANKVCSSLKGQAVILCLDACPPGRTLNRRLAVLRTRGSISILKKSLLGGGEKTRRGNGLGVLRHGPRLQCQWL